MKWGGSKLRRFTIVKLFPVWYNAVDNTDKYGYWSIPRGAVAFVADALLMAIPVFLVAFEQ